MTYRKRYELARSFIAERGLRDQFWAWVISRKKAKSWEEFAEFKHPKKSSAEIIHEYRKAEEERFLKLAKGDKKLAFKLWLFDGYRKKGARKPGVAYFGGFKAQKGGKVNKHIRLCLKSGDKCNGILLKNK